MEKLTASKLRKEYSKAIYCHLVYLTSMQSTSYKMLGWMTHKLESRLLGEISTNSDMQMNHLMVESKEELKSLLRGKEGSEKAGLKLSIQKNQIMASSPLTSWHIEGEKVEEVTKLIFLGSKITAGSDLSHEIKRRLLHRRKGMTNLNSI